MSYEYPLWLLKKTTCVESGLQTPHNIEIVLLFLPLFNHSVGIYITVSSS